MYRLHFITLYVFFFLEKKNDLSTHTVCFGKTIISWFITIIIIIIVIIIIFFFLLRNYSNEY